MTAAKPPRPETDAQLARALRRWEGEGGALPPEPDALAEAERQILKCLGAAVVLEWNHLSRDVQRALFLRAAAVDEAYDPAELKTQIARFLHNHKDDAGPR